MIGIPWTAGLTPLLAAAVVMVAAAGCGRGEPADPLPPGAPALPADPPVPATPAIQPDAAPTAAAPDLQPVAAPTATLDVPAWLPTAVAKVPRTYPTAVPPTPIVIVHPPTPIVIVHPLQRRPILPPAGVELHHSQTVTSVGRMRSTMAPWRDGGGNRLFSTHVFGTPFMLNEKGEIVPWIATAITSNEDMTVWTMKLREDAVFQDGTPITAADLKAYWEHGAKPENIVAWGGASLSLDAIGGWYGLMAGDDAEADGLRVVDDHTLEIRTAVPMPTWPFHMAAWHVGISKLDQVLTDKDWGNAPIGAGPFSLIYAPDSGLTEVTRVDLAGKHWDGPNDAPIIERLVLPSVEDAWARLLMFENGELDVMQIDAETSGAVLDPGHPLNPLLYESPYGGLSFIQMDIFQAPLDDVLFRKALAHGQDMESIVRAIWGPTATHAKGLISNLMPCHNPEARGQSYDPDLARELLAKSQYLNADNLEPLMIHLRQPDMFEMGVAMREYWKDNLGIELDTLKRESDRPRPWRDGPQFYQTSLESWIPDPSLFVADLVYRNDVHYWSRRPESELAVAFLEYARFVPLDRPDRCKAFQAVEEEYLDKVFAIPIREVDPIRWVVQPWLRGFESTFNLDFNTLTTAYVARH